MRADYSFRLLDVKSLRFLNVNAATTGAELQFGSAVVEFAFQGAAALVFDTRQRDLRLHAAAAGAGIQFRRSIFGKANGDAAAGSLQTQIGCRRFGEERVHRAARRVGLDVSLNAFDID